MVPWLAVFSHHDCDDVGTPSSRSLTFPPADIKGMAPFHTSVTVSSFDLFSLSLSGAHGTLYRLVDWGDWPSESASLPAQPSARLLHYAHARVETRRSRSCPPDTDSLLVSADHFPTPMDGEWEMRVPKLPQR